MSEDELLGYIMPSVFLNEVGEYLQSAQLNYTPSINKPDSWDWRKQGVIMHVKNQEQCGSCWAFATAAVVESQHALHQLRTNQTISRTTLSEQQLVDCDSSNNGCSGGFRPYAFKYVKRNGLVPDGDYPYNGKDDNQCRLPDEWPLHSLRDKKPGRVYVDRVAGLEADEEKMAAYLVENGPISVGLTVTKEMFTYKSGVFDPTPEDCATKSVGSHAMEVVGYGQQRQPDGSTVDYWIMKNSWGSYFGLSGGYLHMRRGVDSCGLARAVYTALIDR